MKRHPRALMSQMENLIETALAPGRFVFDNARFSFVSEFGTAEHELARFIPTAPAQDGTLADLDELLGKITVDAHGDDEKLWALRQAFEDDATLPADAFAIGGEACEGSPWT